MILIENPKYGPQKLQSMIERILKINNELDGSIFLFGARQTGKSTMLRQQFPTSIYIDLLDTEIKNRFSRRPVLLYEMLKNEITNFNHIFLCL